MSTPEERNPMLRHLARIEGRPAPSGDPVRAHLESVVKNLWTPRQQRLQSLADAGSPVAAAILEDFVDTGPLRALPDQSKRSAGAGFQFGRGLGQGLVHPIQALTGEFNSPGEYEPEGLGQTIAQGAGYLVGAGVSFLPYYKAASMGLKATGMARYALEGGKQTARFTGGTMVAQGTIAGAGFEFAAGPMDDPVEVAKRVAIGTGLGFGGELAFLGAARAWRSRFPGKPNLRITPDEVGGDVNNLHPVAHAVERQLGLGAGLPEEEIAMRLAAIGGHEKQLELAAVNLARFRDPMSPAIVPLPEKPNAALLKEVFKAKGVPVSFRQAEDKTWEMLIAPKGGRTRLFFRQPREGETQGQLKFLGETGEHLTPDEMADIIRKGSPWFAPKVQAGYVRLWGNYQRPLTEAVIPGDFSGVRPTHFSDSPNGASFKSAVDGKEYFATSYVDVPEEMWNNIGPMLETTLSGVGTSPHPLSVNAGKTFRLDDLLNGKFTGGERVRVGQLMEPGVELEFTPLAGEGIRGDFSNTPDPRDWKIRVSSDLSTSKQIGTIVHEYAHAVHKSMQNWLGVKFTRDWQMKRPDGQKAKTWTEARQLVTDELDETFGRFFGSEKFGYNKDQLLEEFRDATYRVHAYKSSYDPIDLNVSLTSAKRAPTKAELETDLYFTETGELIARGMELLLYSPEIAFKDHAMMTRALIGMVDMMSDKGLRALLSKKHLINIHEHLQSYWTMAPGKAGKITFFEPRHHKQTQRQVKEWQRFGHATGWDVRHKGQTYMLEAIMPQKGGNKGRLRSVGSGDVKEVLLSELDRPILRGLVQRDKELIETVKKTLNNQRPKWVSVRATRKSDQGTGIVEAGVINLEKFDFAKNKLDWIRQNAEAYRGQLKKIREALTDKPPLSCLSCGRPSASGESESPPGLRNH